MKDLFKVFIKLLGAQEVPNTSSNQGISPTSLQPRFSDLGAMGFPNFGSGRVGNPTSNYPTNSFFPFGNQNNYLQRPQQGSGMGYPNQGNYLNSPQQPGYPQQQGYPNLQGYPYQGDSMNPNPNYQRPQYPNQNIQSRPVQGGYPNEDAYPYQGDSNTRYPYQRPTYPNRPDEGTIMYPEDVNRPYQNEGMPPNQGGSAQSFQFPQDNQYPSQGNFQGNPNIRPSGVNPNYRPDDLANTNIHFPERPYQYQPNQYYPQTNAPNQNFSPVQGQPGSFPNYLSNNPNTNVQFPTNNPGGVNGGPSTIQYPNQAVPNQAGSGIDFSGTPVNPGNFNNIHQNQPPLADSQGDNPSDNETAGILGKPVIVPPTNTVPGQPGLDNSVTEAATQKQCVQDCPSTSEYAPVCGTDNVTYVNPGKFDCAQKCGVAVRLQKVGRCPGDIVQNNLEQS
ncbi:hypothetical protein PYW07_002253 [Mythimna separata]|uniref:Kazal-like domain-containing protein n=1 Tax=Mythimna separata TaxID=271217 RepID=A0AAD8DT45_MYTSE|nr:hypothetical protein PYW07_002253 [Mythimna separata]